MPVYIEKINGDVNRPTNQPTDQQSEYRAICLFRKLETRKKAEICNYQGGGWLFDQEQLFKAMQTFSYMTGRYKHQKLIMSGPVIEVLVLPIFLFDPYPSRIGAT